MPPATLTPLLLVLLAGVLNSVQGPTNAMLARAAGSVLTGALISFVVGTTILLAAWIAVRPQTDVAALRGLPPLAWAGGLYGAIYIGAFAFATPRLGIGVAIVVASLGQLAAAIAIDHFGVLGVPRVPLGWTRVAGVGLVVAGIAMVRWR